jgi:tetratricopeptide (TPR) repeat protein
MSLEIDAKIQGWIKDKRALICSENGTDRTSWKKLCIDIGIPTHMVTTAENFDAALDELKSKPEILFCAHQFKTGSGLDIIEEHAKLLPNRANALFFLFSEKNSMAIASAAVEAGVDSFLIKPFNIQALQDNVVKAFADKANLTDFQKDMFHVDELILGEKFDEAREIIQKRKVEKPMNADPLFFEGEINREEDNIEEAIESYDTAFGLDAKHFKTLRSGFNLDLKEKRYQKAYDKLASLLDHFPINPNRIPDYIRISIATNNFDNVVDFCEKILDLNEDLGSDLETPISAGLVISAKYLRESGELEKASEVAMKAIHLAHDREKIIAAALSVFDHEDLRDEGTEIFENLDEKIKKMPEVKAINDKLKS